MSVVPMRFRALAPVANVRRALAERLELSWSVGRPTRVAAGALAAALGLTVVVAWLTGDEALMRVHPLFPPMPYSVAIGLLVCGVALLGDMPAGAPPIRPPSSRRWRFQSTPNPY